MRSLHVDREPLLGGGVERRDKNYPANGVSKTAN